MRNAAAQTLPKDGLGRAGSHALSIFVKALSARTLRAHADGPLSSGELEERLGWAAKASLRAASADLQELGALERKGRRPVVTELTVAGLDLLTVADALERWLSHSPFGPVDLSDPAARGTVRALVAGWKSTIVRTLAGRPHSLAELSPTLPRHSYPALKRRLANLRTAALVAGLKEGARSPEYEATPFLRRAAGPLNVAARWELDHAVDRRGDVYDLEASLLLSLPLVELPARVSGSCVMAMPTERKAGRGTENSPVALSVVVERGKIVAADSTASPTHETWIVGSTRAWLAALNDGRLDDLRPGGPEAHLASMVVSGVHRALSV